MQRALVAVGERRGAQTVIQRTTPPGVKHPRFLVRCDCGAEREISGATLSQAKACRRCSPGGARRKYGDRVMQTSLLYHSWIAMRRRCSAPDDPRNARWAGRGIKVCPEWDASFLAFEQWALANGYRPRLSLDRIDNDGDYTPANCEWVTRSVNSKRCRAAYSFIRRDAKIETAVADIARRHTPTGVDWRPLAQDIAALIGLAAE